MEPEIRPTGLSRQFSGYLDQGLSTPVLA